MKEVYDEEIEIGKFFVLIVQRDLLDLEENMGNESARERVQEIRG